MILKTWITTPFALTLKEQTFNEVSIEESEAKDQGYGAEDIFIDNKTIIDWCNKNLRGTFITKRVALVLKNQGAIVYKQDFAFPLLFLKEKGDKIFVMLKDYVEGLIVRFVSEEKTLKPLDFQKEFIRQTMDVFAYDHSFDEEMQISGEELLIQILEAQKNNPNYFANLPKETV